MQGSNALGLPEVAAPAAPLMCMKEGGSVSDSRGCSKDAPMRSRIADDMDIFSAFVFLGTPGWNGKLENGVSQPRLRQANHPSHMGFLSIMQNILQLSAFQDLPVRCIEPAKDGFSC